VISLIEEAGLDGIEWGSDVHVPPGNLENARAVGRQTRDAGLSVAGYGSYWFAFDKNPQPEPFEPLIETAIALGASAIRVWAGSLTLPKTPDYFETVVEQSRAFAEAASQVHIKVAYEYHPDTFTETLEGTQKLLAAVNHPNLYTYWQPRHGSTLRERIQDICELKDRLINVHVFHWNVAAQPPYPRLPLEEGAPLWQPCFKNLCNHDGYALLEFVRDDDPRQFNADAAMLKSWLKN
jgi:sugar phosphate isomerase/epimerase